MCTRIRKGIINPNYPGFQSLAYTLNDDHFDYSSENPSDDDDEDSYVSESDDNEVKRRQEDEEAEEEEEEEEEAGDENGNSYEGDGGKGPPHSGVDVPPVKGKLSAGLFHRAITTSLDLEEPYPGSPVQRSRGCFIPTGCHSPSLTDAAEKQESIGIYACTPPDIVLQHGFDPRTSLLACNSDLSKASLELSTSQRPDLIPERQLREQQARYQLEFHELTGQDGQKSSPAVGDLENNLAEEVLDDEGNRTPPSPAIEHPIGTASLPAGDCGNTLEPMSTRCYGSPTDGTLSDDSEPESDDVEFEYKPYGAVVASDDGFQPSEEPSESPGDSAGSSPGELQYHLVDDCSNQTVQITRSRQSSDHAAANYYHLLQQYSSPRPVDYHNNRVQPGEAMDRELSLNQRRGSPGQLAQKEPSADGCPYFPRPGRIANQEELVSTDISEIRPSTLSFSRRDPIQPTYAPRPREEGHVVSSVEKKVADDTPKTNADVSGVPARQPQKVAKVNPFCELLLQENDTCDFFTKQAKLQIEARMALCQAKDMAHMQMEIEKRSLLQSPVTQVIHTAVEKAGLSLAADKRRLSRYYLTRLNVHQLQTILTELQGHAEVLNEELVELLMERDELHISQDATLIDIEDLSRYLCAKEQTIIHAERQRKSYHWNRAVHHPKQSSLAQPQLRSAGGTVIPSYRYH